MEIQSLSKEIVDHLVKTLGLQSAVDKIPTELNANIQPVLDVNPKRVITHVKRVQTTTTMHTCDSVKETYLVGYNMSASKDAGVGLARNQMYCTLDSGVGVIFANIDLALGAGVVGPEAVQECVAQDFTIPIKLQKGSVIGSTLGCTYGNFCVFLYEVDVL